MAQLDSLPVQVFFLVFLVLNQDLNDPDLNEIEV